MYLKQCPNCGEKSYSASKKGKWECPVCECDLSDKEAQRPEEN